MKSFYLFLMKTYWGKNSPEGELARVLYQDKTLPYVQPKETLRSEYRRYRNSLIHNPPWLPPALYDTLLPALKHAFYAYLRQQQLTCSFSDELTRETYLFRQQQLQKVVMREGENSGIPFGRFSIYQGQELLFTVSLAIALRSANGEPAWLGSQWFYRNRHGELTGFPRAAVFSKPMERTLLQGILKGCSYAEFQCLTVCTVRKLIPFMQEALQVYQEAQEVILKREARLKNGQPWTMDDTKKLYQKLCEAFGTAVKPTHFHQRCSPKIKLAVSADGTTYPSRNGSYEVFLRDATHAKRQPKGKQVVVRPYGFLELVQCFSSIDEAAAYLGERIHAHWSVLYGK